MGKIYERLKNTFIPITGIAPNAIIFVKPSCEKKFHHRRWFFSAFWLSFLPHLNNLYSAALYANINGAIYNLLAHPHLFSQAVTQGLK